MTGTIKILLYASLEIILGAVILYFNLKAFLLYFLIIYLINSHRRTESLDIRMRMNILVSTIWAYAIIQKLGINNEELEKSISKVISKVKDWDLLMDGIEEVTGERFNL